MPSLDSVGLSQEELSRLRAYRGADPRPQDFEAFWAARMAEADAVPLDFGLSAADVPSTPVCDFLDLWFCGMGGARLHAKYLRPKSAELVPVVLQFHGYPGASRSWLEQCSFAGMGMALVALDCPGQGGPSEDVGGFPGTTVCGHIVAGTDGEPEDLYYVRLHQDVRILCRVVRELEGLDLSRVYVNGASQGGGIGLATCALNADLVRRAAILYPFLSDYRMVWELGLDVVAYDGIGYFSRWFSAAGERQDELFSKLAYVDSKNFAPMVSCPVLFGTGLEDTVVPLPTQFAVYNALGCEKEHHLYPGFGHEEIQEFDDLIIDFFCQDEGRGRA